MNKKSILYIFIVLMALSFTLSAVSAEDAATAVATDAPAVPVVENAPVAADAAGEMPVADLEVNIAELYEDDIEIIWAITVINHGPDIAYNTTVYGDSSYNLLALDYFATEGYVDPILLTWNVGDMKPEDIAFMFVETGKLDEGPYYVDALVLSDSYDPDYSNNYAIVFAGEVPVAEAAEETLPAAGNPIAVALLALLAVGIGGIKRRF